MPTTSHKAKRGKKAATSPDNVRILTVRPKGKPKRPGGNPDIGRYAVQGALTKELSGGIVGVNKQLAEIIRAIGSEQIDPQTGWTRVAVVVRRLYSEAMSGKVDAAKLLFERGWGLMPKPIQVSVRAEIVQHIQEAGLTLAQAWQDPVMREVMETNGLTVDERGLPQLIIDGQVVDQTPQGES